MRRILFFAGLFTGIMLFFWRNPAQWNRLRDRLASSYDALLRIGIGA